MALALAGAVALVGCAGSGNVDPYVGPRPVRESAQWDVLAGDRLVGRVVELRIDGVADDQPFYQVRNAEGQWLGMIDSQGRVFQREPLSMTDRFKGVYPMTDGVALLCQQSGAVTLTSRNQR